MFPIVLLGAKTKTGLELALKCIEFSGTEAVNSNDPILNFKYAVLVQSVEPFQNVENPSLEDYYYEKLSEGFKSYSNQTLRVDLEIVNGIPQPILEQAKNENGDLLFEEDGVTPIMIPTMIGNIDFWLKFGGSAVLQDLKYTLSQIGQQPVETFIKEYQS
jgi:hypothetical protein